MRWFLFFLLVGAAFQLPAQQSEADRKLLADVRAKAEKGEAQSQYKLGKAFYDGSLGVVKDEAEAVKWFRRAAEQNLADAQSNLGACYADGQGVADYNVWLRFCKDQSLAGELRKHGLVQTLVNGSYVNVVFSPSLKRQKPHPKEPETGASGERLANIRMEGLLSPTTVPVSA